MRQYVARKIRSPATRNHRANAITERAGRDQRGSRACARSEQSDRENDPTSGSSIDPAYRMHQPLAEQLDVEHIPPVVLFFGQQKVEQQRRDPVDD